MLTHCSIKVFFFTRSIFVVLVAITNSCAHFGKNKFGAYEAARTLLAEEKTHLVLFCWSSCHGVLILGTLVRRKRVCVTGNLLFCVVL
jgi:hypothetical protein